MLNGPTYTHDCERCKLLGTTLGGMQKHDLYFCEGIGHVTLIARYGNDGPDYLSTPLGYARPEGHSELFVAQSLYTQRTA